MNEREKTGRRSVRDWLFPEIVDAESALRAAKAGAVAAWWVAGWTCLKFGIDLQTGKFAQADESYMIGSIGGAAGVVATMVFLGWRVSKGGRISAVMVLLWIVTEFIEALLREQGGAAITATSIRLILATSGARGAFRYSAFIVRKTGDETREQMGRSA